MVASSTHEQAMRAAIAMAKQQPNAPFGAVLVDNRSGKMVARGVNRGKENPAWHGEIDVINRYAAAKAKPNWGDLTLYTTAEPCPMCMAAIAWAGIPHVVYGSDIPTLQQQGWRQIDIRAEQVIAKTPFVLVKLTGGVLQKDCDRLFTQARARHVAAKPEPSQPTQDSTD